MKLQSKRVFIKGQIPVLLGGTSASLVDLAIVLEELHAVKRSTVITLIGTGLGMMPLILAGTDELRANLAPFSELEGSTIASFAHSEPSGTANWLEKGASGLQTTAYKDGNDWIVNGEKAYKILTLEGSGLLIHMIVLND